MDVEANNYLLIKAKKYELGRRSMGEVGKRA
jgi:hypothetical protein